MEETVSKKQVIKEQSTTSRTLLIAFMGLMIALEFVFERLLVINIGATTRFSLTFVPRAVSGICFGMLPAAGIAMSADLIGSFAIFGSVNPGITLANGVRGLIYGSILRKNVSVPRILICAFLDQFICGFLMVTTSLVLISGLGSFSLAFYMTRLPQAIILFVLESTVLVILLPFLPQLKSMVSRLLKK